jgi:hypothetical protein
MKSPSLLSVLCATTILVSANAAYAADKQAAAKLATPETKSDFTKALTEGKPILDARYRYEYVDQDGLANDANAHTIRTRLGYETGKFHDFSALLEFENITDIGGENYNDTINGKATYPTVADPEDTNVNRLQLTYTGLPETALTLGRQSIVHDNQRFVGGIAWRQNDQTFDAISAKNQSIKDLTLNYAYAWQVNRIFGTDSASGIWDDTNIHLINASYAGLPFGKITGYSYLLDIPDSLALSSATYGARFEGKHGITEGVTGLLNLEYAHQNDYDDNPNNISFDYYAVEPGVAFGQWTVKGLYESIEGNGTNAMQFALGTNHAFDGWADKFLTTPANGLVDASIGLHYAAKSENKWLNGTKAAVVYHDFSAERGSSDYGTEWNALLEQTFEKHYTAGIKFASYNADDLYTDTVKVMPYVQVKF